MRNMTLLAAIVVLLPNLAVAHVVRHGSIPQSFWEPGRPAQNNALRPTNRRSYSLRRPTSVLRHSATWNT